MQNKLTWIALLGVVSGLLQPVVADGPLTDPNLSVIRDFNVVLTENTKVSDLSCCMGATGELGNVPEYQCFPHQAMQMGNEPGARRIGIQYCHLLPGQTPDGGTKTFKDLCTELTGELIVPDQGYCPQIWPNYKNDYKKPAPPAAKDDEPAKPAPEPTKPDVAGKASNDKDGFKTKGIFMYSLVDYAITQSLSCCAGSTAPLVKPHKYKCAQRKASNAVFMKQCATILPTITKAKKLEGYTTIGDDAGAIVDQKTKDTCSALWTNALSYTYGFCQLDFDGAATEAVAAFESDCTAAGGQLKKVHNGMCLWNIDQAASDS